VLAELEPRCQLSEPEDLWTQLPGLLGDRILLGGLFAINTEKHLVRADATRLVVREINTIAQGISGRQLGILICNNDADGDSSNNDQETTELVRYLAGTLAVPVILGPTSSSNSITATNILLGDRLPTAIISPSATSPALTDLPDRLNPGDPLGLFWRTCPSDALQGKVLAQVISGTRPGVVVPDGLDRVAVIYQNDAYGSGLQQVFRDQFTLIDGAHEVGGFSFEIGEADLANALTNAAGFGPDAVMVISSDATRTVSVLEAAQGHVALQGRPYFLTDGSKDAAVLLSAANSPGVKGVVVGVIGTAPASPSGSAYQTFADSLQNQFGRDASQFSFVAHSYDAAYVGSYGIVFAHVVPAFDAFPVVDGLSRLSAGLAINVGPNDFQAAVTTLTSPGGSIDIAGTSGPLNFDAALGEAPGDIEIWSVCDPDGGGCSGAPVPGAQYVFETELVVPAEDL
jgi:branched-chain amino acid transport system substrate-binding protein